ncbi:hypothetical protein Aduo_003050 [Ancylostoma duodenale]
MNKLEWDCGLENRAAKRCSNGMIDTNFLYRTGAASTLVTGPGCYPKPLSFDDFKKAMDEWWREASAYSDNHFTDKTKENFAQMANANATQVGCSFEKKGRLTSVLCLYNSRVVLNDEY